MNAGSAGLIAVNGPGGYGGAAAPSAGTMGNDIQAIVVILPPTREAAAKGDSTDISDSSCECRHHCAAPAPGWKTPAPRFTPSAGAADAGQPAGGGRSGGVLQVLMAVLAMLMLLLKKLLGLEDSSAGHEDHCHSHASARASQQRNGGPTAIVID